MDKIGMFDAKTRFSQIVEQVQATGQPVTITKRGQPVVDIIPTHTRDQTRMGRPEAFDVVARIHERIGPVKRGEIREMIHAGRRG